LKFDSGNKNVAFVTLDESNAIVNEADPGNPASLAARHFTDLFVLKKKEGRWKITSKVFTTFPKGE
jgi:hypothetical protein